MRLDDMSEKSESTKMVNAAKPRRNSSVAKRTSAKYADAVDSLVETIKELAQDVAIVRRSSIDGALMTADQLKLAVHVLIETCEQQRREEKE